MNRSDEERDAAPRWIESKQRISAEDLRAANGPLGEIPRRRSLQLPPRIAATWRYIPERRHSRCVM